MISDFPLGMDESLRFDMNLFSLEIDVYEGSSRKTPEPGVSFSAWFTVISPMSRQPPFTEKSKWNEFPPSNC